MNFGTDGVDDFKELYCYTDCQMTKGDFIFTTCEIFDTILELVFGLLARIYKFALQLANGSYYKYLSGSVLSNLSNIYFV